MRHLLDLVEGGTTTNVVCTVTIAMGEERIVSVR